MADPHEIEALKASYRGALATARDLEAIGGEVGALESRAEIDRDVLESIARVSLAHAVSSQALRGFIESMLARRG